MVNLQKGKVTLLAIVLVLVFIAALVWMVTYLKSQFYPQSQLIQRPIVLNPSPGQNLTYINRQFNFQFDYPSNWVIGEINANNEKILHSILQVAPKRFSIQPPPIKLLYSDNPNRLSLQDLEKKINPDPSTPILYSSDDVYTLSGKGLALNFRSQGNCVTYKCQIYTFSNLDKVYQLVNFPDTNSPNQQAVFMQVINSFRFLGGSSTFSASPKM